MANRHRSDRDRDRGTERNREKRRGETEETDPHTEKWQRQTGHKREEDNEEKPPLMEGIGGEGGVVPVAAVGI